MKTSKTKINVGYSVHGEGFSLNPDGNSPYSVEYYKRLSMADKGEIPQNEVYGLQQALEHIEAMRRPTGSEYDTYWSSVRLWVEKTILITEVIE